MTTYTYESLIDANIRANFEHYPHPEFKGYYQRLLTALEDGFGIKLSEEGLSEEQIACFRNFELLARSYAPTRQTIREYSDTNMAHHTIESLDDDGKAAVEHIKQIKLQIDKLLPPLSQTLDDLFFLMFGEIETEISSDMLRRMGFDDREKYVLDCLESWDLMDRHYSRYFRKDISGFGFLRPFVTLMKVMREKGYDKRLFANQSHYYLRLSRTSVIKSGMLNPEILFELSKSSMRIQLYSMDVTDSPYYFDTMEWSDELRDLLDRLVAEPIIFS